MLQNYFITQRQKNMLFTNFFYRYRFFKILIFCTTFFQKRNTFWDNQRLLFKSSLCIQW